MRNLLIVLAMLFLASCGSKTEFVQGVDGTNGTNCTVVDVEEGALVACEDGTEVLVENGNDGVDGNDGENYSCSVSEVDGGALITCTDGSSVLIPGGDDDDSDDDDSDDDDSDDDDKKKCKKSDKYPPCKYGHDKK